MAEKSRLDDYDRIEPRSRAGWRQWLSENHTCGEGVWLVYPRKGSGLTGPTVEDAAEEALCFGWIDSLPRALDEKRTMLLVAPRKRGSNWLAINKARVEKLIRAKLMTPAGLAVIEAAKMDGAWAALDHVEALVEPDDLGAAFKAHPGSRGHWDGFPRSVKRGILEWILNAKKPETRAARITETAEKAAQNIRANQWRQ